MSALKVALINTFYPPYNFGGDGIYVRRMAHSLARLGCEVHVLHDTDTYRALTKSINRPMHPLDEPQGVTVHRLASRFSPASVLLTHQTGRPMAHRKALDEFFSIKFDVTHFHNVSALGGPGVLSRGDGVRLYTAHEHWLVCPTHILWRYNREVCDSRKCFSCQLSYRRPPQLWRHTDLLRKQTDNIDAFIALSESSAANHEKFGFHREMTVLPSFLPEEKTSPTILNPQGKPYALFVGRLEKLKGLQDVIPAFVGRQDIDLVIVGEGEYADQLRIAASGADNIKFVGRRSPEELGVFYEHAAAVLLPSVCLEVFPLVALEAFRAGAPIIARNLGPFPEIIRRSGAGVLFNDPAEIAPAAALYASDKSLRREIGERARKAFFENWSERVFLSAYFNLVVEKAQAKGMDEIVAKTRKITEKLETSP